MDREHHFCPPAPLAPALPWEDFLFFRFVSWAPAGLLLSSFLPLFFQQFRA